MDMLQKGDEQREQIDSIEKLKFHATIVTAVSIVPPTELMKQSLTK